MKKLNVLFLSLVALTATVTSCSKNDNPTPATELDLTIKDASSNLVSGAKVVLYSDANFTVKVDSMTTDATGIAKFSKNLKSQAYYFSASKADGCLSNYYTTTATVDSGGTSAIAIPANKTTSYTVEVISMGTIIFENDSTTDSYNVYIKTTAGSTYSNLLTTLATSGKAQLPVPIGSFDVKFIKLNSDGVTEIPGSDVVKAANAVTACGTTTVTVP